MTQLEQRRAFLRLSTAGAAALAWGRGAFGADQKRGPEKMTFTYKTVGECAIKADVYREDDTRTRPVVVWIHGGALINGHREGISQRLENAPLKAGHALVLID